MRATSTAFKVSDPIQHNQAAMSTKPSVRQCFLYFAALINDRKAAFWPETFGLPLTDQPRNDPAREQHSRTGKAGKFWN
ncbi:hypothetical protein Aspvir_009287 [Aspergillus viridinutans]|uniref:Uncharacterized protein n=1 Tax=Aspergillus viridinutans TaxID=75553 RepID=A0A9P3C7C7_ASPVI|nr:uncharacterized protein Aspvir_009287 [Aspergillus viridinutans]GIK05184.1 hypothetical protein Aspvir_009287 [Aspergillus viridinutans]